jgi:CRP-like cAMP-binding protein
MVGPMNVAAALQASSLFQGFTETGIAIFAAIAVERRFPAGAALFAEGQPGESLFVIASGSVRIVERCPAGERELAQAGAGDSVGALAVLAPGARLSSAIAATEVEAAELSATAFLEAAKQKPQACLKLALRIAREVADRGRASREALRLAAARAGGGG